MIDGKPNKKWTLKPEDAILPIIHEVRRELALENPSINDPESPKYRYTGLCYEAASRFIDKLLDKYQGFDETTDIHGEMKHILSIDPNNWPCQHTWVKVIHEAFGIYYVDPTYEQFYNVIPPKPYTQDDFPKYWMSNDPPPYFYPDRNNPVFGCWIFGKFRPLRWLNEKIRIKHKHPYDANRTVEDGLIEYIQYEIWGRIAKFLRKVLFVNEEATNWRT